MGRTRNAVGQQCPRGFDSLSLRRFSKLELLRMNIKREKDTGTYLILDDGVEKELDVSNFNREHNIDGVIRIQKYDYPHFPKKKYFSHFNLQYCGHVVGSIYVLPEIVRPGYFINENKQKLPLLEFSGKLVGECVEVRNNLSYEDLSEEDFEYSFEHIKNTESLKKAMVRRYSISMPKLSAKEILEMGISLTKLKIIRNI
jgi:hypothetical protein